MQNTGMSVRSVEMCAGCFRILTAAGILRDVLDESGTSQWVPSGAWSAHSCVEIAGECYLLPLNSADGGLAVAVLDKSFRFLNEIKAFQPSQDPEAFRYLVLAATALFEYLETRLVHDSDEPVFVAFSRMGFEALVSLARLISFTPQRLAVDRLPPSLRYQCGDRSSSILAAAVSRCLQSREWLVQNAARKGRVEIPAICQEGSVDRAFLIGRDADSPIYFCVENTSGLNFYVIFRTHKPAVLYLPAFRAMLCESAAPLEGETVRLLDHIRRALCSFMVLGVRRNGVVFEGLGLTTFGYRHFGHAIWDEMHALDTFLCALPQAQTLRALYYVPENSAIDEFGPVEDIYPELRNKVLRAPSEPVIYAHAIANGTELVLRNGRRSLQATRDRICHYIGRRYEGTDLDRLVHETLRAGDKMRLVVTLGLRLTNRVPEDLLGFYIALVRALHRRFGPLVIVLDGIAGSADAKKPALAIFNASKRWDDSLSACFRDGAAELAEELKWGDAFQRALGELDEDIVLVNCVGSPIQENLFWMQQSHFFVAPYGGGLGKLRWALDIPGFVLTSRVNLEYCDQLHVYDDDKFTEPPYQPLYFTSVEDVEDLPANPPRTERPADNIGIPHPDDFRIKQLQVIGRIVGLVSLHSPLIGAEAVRAEACPTRS